MDPELWKFAVIAGALGAAAGGVVLLVSWLETRQDTDDFEIVEVTKKLELEPAEDAPPSEFAGEDPPSPGDINTGPS